MIPVAMQAISGSGRKQVRHIRPAIALGTARRVKIKCTLPETLTTGIYSINVETDSGHHLLEHGDGPGGQANAENNTATATPIDITQGGPDLAINFVDQLALPAPNSRCRW